MTSSSEWTTQLEMVVNLSVENDSVSPIRRLHRLVPTFDIENAQPPHAESEVAVDKYTRVVRTAMPDCVALSGNDSGSDGPPSPPVPPCDAAHCLSSTAAFPLHELPIDKSANFTAQWLVRCHGGDIESWVDLDKCQSNRPAVSNLVNLVVVVEKCGHHCHETARFFSTAPNH